MASVVDPSEDHFEIIERISDVFQGSANIAGLAMTDYWRGYLLYGLGQPNQALTYFNRAKSGAMNVENSRVLKNLNNNLAQTYAAACQYDEAKVYFEKVKDYERRQIHQGASPISFAYSLSCEGLMLADKGLFEQADQCFDEAELLCADGADYIALSVLDHRVAAEIWRGEYGGAKVYAEKVLSMTARMRSRYHHVMANSLFNIAAWLEAPEDKYAEELREMTSWMERNNLRQYVSINYGYLSHMGQAHEDNDLCRIYAARALRRAKSGDRLGEAMACRSLTRLFENSGQSQKARTYFKRAEESAQIRASAREMAQNQSLKETLNLETTLAASHSTER